MFQFKFLYFNWIYCLLNIKKPFNTFNRYNIHTGYFFIIQKTPQMLKCHTFLHV